jgi:hypothetical protein
MSYEEREIRCESVGVGVRAFGGDLVIAVGWHDFLFGIAMRDECLAIHCGPFQLIWFGEQRNG